MIPEAAVVLHAGPGHEVTFAGYLYRVVVHLVAVGAVAVVLYWSLGRDGPVRTALGAGDSDETVEHEAVEHEAVEHEAVERRE